MLTFLLLISALGFLDFCVFFIVHHGFLVVLPLRLLLDLKITCVYAVVVLRPSSIPTDPFLRFKGLSKAQEFICGRFLDLEYFPF